MTTTGYVNVDQLQSETSLEKAATMCGASIDAHGSGNEVRLDCPFSCDGDHLGRREIAVNNENPQKVFLCHAWQCGFNGNSLTLMHGMIRHFAISTNPRRTFFKRLAETVISREYSTNTGKKWRFSSFCPLSEIQPRLFQDSLLSAP